MLRSNHYKLIFGLILSLPFWTNSTTAFAQQYLNDPTVIIARHDKRTSSVKLPRGGEGSELDYWGMSFEAWWWEKRDESHALLVHYEELPKCEKSKVDLLEVASYTPISAVTDIVYYNEEDREQYRAAKKYKGLAVAYEAALMRNPKTGSPDTLQSFARFIQVRCLPTRFRYIDIGSRHYQETRTGKQAWKE